MDPAVLRHDVQFGVRVMTKMPGPGSELKRLFSLMLVGATPECLCHGRARLMDEMGVRWCADNIEYIVDWLEDEAKDRGIPFVRRSAQALVLMSIKRSTPRHARMRIFGGRRSARVRRRRWVLWGKLWSAAVCVSEPAVRMVFAWSGFRRCCKWICRSGRRVGAAERR